MQFIFHKRAKKTLCKYPKHIQQRIYTAISYLPEEGDVKRMKGKNTPSLYRLRVGDFRVVYSIEKELITIVKIDSRGDIYK